MVTERYDDNDGLSRVDTLYKVIGTETNNLMTRLTLLEIKRYIPRKYGEEMVLQFLIGQDTIENMSHEVKNCRVVEIWNKIYVKCKNKEHAQYLFEYQMVRSGDKFRPPSDGNGGDEVEKMELNV